MANYDHVNAAWPEQMPVPTAQEAIAATKKLVRVANKCAPPGAIPIQIKHLKFEATSGRRYTWVRNRVFYVNPNGKHFGGWKDLVHDISHWAFNKLYDRRKLGSHPAQHAFIERTLAEHVVKSGWLDGKLKRQEKPQADLRTARHQRIIARMASWERKQKRAETALKKLSKQLAYYERTLNGGR